MRREKELNKGSWFIVQSSSKRERISIIRNVYNCTYQFTTDIVKEIMKYVRNWHELIKKFSMVASL